MKPQKQYYFSVEGETEQWYLEYLQKLINNCTKATSTVKFQIKICKSITKRAKSIPAIYGTRVFHICDYESNDEIHVNQFNQILEELKKVKQINKMLDYKLGYSNFTFDLWIILHKKQQNSSVIHRKQYVKGINKAYRENFEFLDEYKKEANFKRILSKIKIEDVIKAVKRGNEIRAKHKEDEDRMIKYGKFEYYRENPDMTINECIEEILKDCEIL